MKANKQSLIFLTVLTVIFACAGLQAQRCETSSSVEVNGFVQIGTGAGIGIGFNRFHEDDRDWDDRDWRDCDRDDRDWDDRDWRDCDRDDRDWDDRDWDDHDRDWDDSEWHDHDWDDRDWGPRRCRPFFNWYSMQDPFQYPACHVYGHLYREHEEEEAMIGVDLCRTDPACAEAMFEENLYAISRELGPPVYRNNERGFRNAERTAGWIVDDYAIELAYVEDDGDRSLEIMALPRHRCEF